MRHLFIDVDAQFQNTVRAEDIEERVGAVRQFVHDSLSPYLDRLQGS